MSRKILATAFVALVLFALFMQSVISLIAQQNTLSANIQFYGTVTEINTDPNRLIIDGNVILTNVTETGNPAFSALLRSQAWKATLVLPIQRDQQGNPTITGHGYLQVQVKRPDSSRLILNFIVSNILINHIDYILNGVVDVDGEGDTPSQNTQPTDDWILQTLEAEITPFGPEDFFKTIDAMDTQYPRTATPGSGMPTGQPTVSGPNS